MCPSSPITADSADYETFDRHSHSHSHGLSPKVGIPLPSYHIQRTESEVQLREDMAVAEYRDRIMFNRLITGIRKRQYECQHHQYYGPSHDSRDQQARSRHSSRPGLDTTYETQDITASASWPMQQTDRTIENIISTRCQSGTQDQANVIADITPETSYNNNDWSIGGFDDEPRSPAYIHVNLIPEGWDADVSSHNDQLFDMDL